MDHPWLVALSGDYLHSRDSDVAFSPDARSVVVAGEDTGAAGAGSWPRGSGGELRRTGQGVFGRRRRRAPRWVRDRAREGFHLVCGRERRVRYGGGIRCRPTGENAGELVPPTPGLEPRNRQGNGDELALAATASPSGMRLRGTVIFTPSDFAVDHRPDGRERRLCRWTGPCPTTSPPSPSSPTTGTTC